jgi:hypothetical protein
VAPVADSLPVSNAANQLTDVSAFASTPTRNIEMFKSSNFSFIELMKSQKAAKASQARRNISQQRAGLGLATSS